MTAESWLDRCVRLLLMLIDLLYFPIVQQIFAVSSACPSATPPLPLPLPLLVDAPYLLCSSDQVRGVRAAAAVFTVVYVFGIPLVYGLILRDIHVNASQTDKRTALRFGFLYLIYGDQRHFFYFVSVAERVLTAAAVYLLPFRSSAVSVALFVLLLLSNLVHQHFRPYHRPADNWLYTTLLISILVAYLCSLVPAAPGVLTTGQAVISWGILAWNLILLVFVL
jgi:hypothetical protein